MAVLTNNTVLPANTSVRQKTGENLRAEQELQEEVAASDQHSDQQLGTPQQTTQWKGQTALYWPLPRVKCTCTYSELLILPSASEWHTQASPAFDP